MEVCIYSKEKHQVIVEAWLNDWKEAVNTINFLPPTGIIVYHDKLPVCVGFLTKTDSGIAIITNILSDKNADREIKNKCVDSLLFTLDGLAEVEKFKMICVATIIPSVIKRFQKMDYFIAKEQFTNLGRYLCPGFP